jgi:hypothetical protein
LKKFISFIREQYRIAWRDIYWKCWAHKHLFSCNTCGQTYHAHELESCEVTPEMHKNDQSSGSGKDSSVHAIKPIHQLNVGECCLHEISVMHGIADSDVNHVMEMLVRH